jgi:hypothetical protein
VNKSHAHDSGVVSQTNKDSKPIPKQDSLADKSWASPPENSEHLYIERLQAWEKECGFS